MSPLCLLVVYESGVAPRNNDQVITPQLFVVYFTSTADVLLFLSKYVRSHCFATARRFQVYTADFIVYIGGESNSVRLDIECAPPNVQHSTSAFDKR